MGMSEVTAKLVDVHRSIQEDSGYDPDAVRETSCPLKDIKGFDSLLIPTAIRSLARALGVKLPKNTRLKNIYISEDGTRKLTIAQIATEFSRIYLPAGANV